MPGKPLVIPDATALARLRKELPGWTVVDGSLQREFRTDGWPATLMLLNAIGFLSEAADHHPDLHVSWGKLEVRLQTHVSGGITERDFALAGEIEKLALWKPPSGSALKGAPKAWVRGTRK